MRHKNKLVYNILIIWHVISVLAGCKGQSDCNEVLIVINTNNIISEMQGGFGASIHAIEDSIEVSTYKGNYRSWGGSVWGANPMLDDNESWEKVFDYTDWMGLDWCRVEVEHQMYKPSKNILDTSCNEMQLLYKWLDYCQDRNVDVLLTEMWPNVEWLAHENFRDNPRNILLSAPNNFKVWADGYADIIEYLIKKRQYTCIKWISIANEPMEIWSWWKAADGSSQDIIPALQAMSREIDSRNLPVKLVAPDGNLKVDKNGMLNPHIMECINNAKAISSHNYQACFDWDTLSGNDKMTNFELTLEKWKKFGQQNGNKPLFVGEFGSFLYGIEKDTDGPSRYLSLLKDAQFVIRTSQVGVDAYNKWSLLNRGNLDGQWQLIETWDMVNNSLLSAENIAPNKNGINMYGMFPRFTNKYSKVIATQTIGAADSVVFTNVYGYNDTLKHVFATCFQCPTTNSYSVFITNDSEEMFSSKIVFKGLEEKKPLYRYEINEKQKDKRELLLQPLENYVLDKTNSINIQISPRSVICISNFNLQLEDNGI